MGYAVTRLVGTTDGEFEEYIRLLRQRGVDIGRVPRVLDPKTGNRWLHVWADREDAQNFAAELNQQTPEEGWLVVDVEVPFSEGPLGPILIQLARQTDGLTFAIHPLSRALIRSAFPTAAATTTYATIDDATWADFVRKRGGVAELVQEIAPGLTGLDRDQLESVGYTVRDSDSDQTIVSVPPTVPAQV